MSGEFTSIKQKEPTESGAYICVVTGQTSLKMLNFHINEDGYSWWTSSNGIECKRVSHWFKCPAIPDAILINMLVKKASEQALEPDEKKKLIELLQKSD